MDTSSQPQMVDLSTDLPPGPTITGPDSLKMPTTLLEPQGSHPQGEGNYEARYSGLMKKYTSDREQWDKDRKAWTDGFAAMQTKIQQLEAQIAGPGKATAKAAPAPKPAEDEGVDDRYAELYDQVLELTARQRRDNLIFQYMQPGQPGAGLNLFAFRENIPVVIDDTDDDNDKGQREAIEGFINALRGLTGNAQQQTQQALISGWTPGASPGMPPPGQSDKEKEAEYYRLKELYGSAEFDKMTPVEQARVERAYYDLHERFGQYLPGQTRPWMTAEEIMASVTQLQGKIGQFEQMLARKG